LDWKRSVALLATGLALFALALWLRSSSGPLASMRGPHSFSRLLGFFGGVVLPMFVVYALLMHRVKRFLLDRHDRVGKRKQLANGKT
jgi:hypothetical protein